MYYKIMDSGILEIQIKTDVQILEENAKAGLYKDDSEGYSKARKRILEKMKEWTKLYQKETEKSLASMAQKIDELAEESRQQK